MVNLARDLVDKTCRNCGKSIVRPAHGHQMPYQHETASDCPMAVPGPYPDHAAQQIAPSHAALDETVEHSTEDEP